MPSVLMQSTDADAPVLQSNVAGSLINVLKYALVLGYGTTPPLGWEVVFEDTIENKIVFRQGEAHGNKILLRVHDNGAGAEGQYAHVTMYESMSDIDYGAGPCPPVGNDSHYFCKGAYNDTTPIPWKIIGDARGFWFIPQPWVLSTDKYDVFWHPHYVGEWTCNYQENVYNQLTILSRSDHTYYFYPGGGEASYALRNPITQAIGCVTFTPNIRFSSNVVFGVYYGASNPRTINGRSFYEPITTYYGSNYLIGRFPGVLSMIYHTIGNSYTFTAEEKLPYMDQVSSDRSILTLVCRKGGAAYTGINQRLSFIIGEGFRDAY
jgi:hypothetical protein